MKAIPITKYGKPETLKITDFPDPITGVDDVLIRVKAFGVNFADIMARKGLYEDAPNKPFVPGYEVAGVVEKTGKNVKSFAPGDRVMAITPFGGYAEFAVTRSTGCVKIPAIITDEQAASIPVVFLTALHSLLYTGPLFPNDRVLIHAAAGGVGQAAVQIAKWKKAVIIGTAGSDAKIKLLQDQGVDYTINYRKQDYAKGVKNLFRPEGIDIILDSIAGDNVKKGISLLRAHGRVVVFGVAAFSDRSIGKMPGLISSLVSMLTINSVDMMRSSLGLYTVNMKRIGDEKPELLEHEFKELAGLFSSGVLKPVLERSLSWKEIAKAHDDMENRRTTGKTVMIID